MAVPNGSKTLVQGLEFLLSLHAQLLNLPAEQEIGRYGVMVPRWAAAPGSTPNEIRELEKKVYGRRFAQDVRIVDAIKVVRELIGEHEMSSLSVPASELGPKDPEDPNG